MTLEEASRRLDCMDRFLKTRYNDYSERDHDAFLLAIKALENNIVPVVIRDGDYEFDGMLDKNRQLLYAKPYTAEYVKKVLGMSWREADNE